MVCFYYYYLAADIENGTHICFVATIIQNTKKKTHTKKLFRTYLHVLPSFNATSRTGIERLIPLQVTLIVSNTFLYH